MKKIIFTVLLCCFSKGFAQESFFFEFPWQLISFHYDGGDYPTTEDFHSLEFTYGEPHNLTTAISENVFEAFVSFDENAMTLTTSESEVTDFPCENYCDLEADYLAFYYNEGKPKTFSYDITYIDFPEGYILTVTDEFDNYAVYMDTLLSTQQTDDISLISAYPNPVTHSLYVSNPKRLPVSVTLYTLRGQSVLCKTNAENAVDVSGIPAGVYFLEIAAEGKRKVQQIIKK
jgi:hypothetical protein